MSANPSPARSRTVHIVGGGFNQIPLVQQARSMGLRVLVTDGAEAPPARALADVYERCDTTDREATLDCARRHGVELITTDQTDVAVPTVAYAAEQLGVMGIGLECALRFTNKHLMRQALRPTHAAHLPDSHVFDSADDAIMFCAAHGTTRDHIVKPVDSQGSRGVRVLDGECAGPVRAAFGHSAAGAVLIERFIRGPEYSVEAFVCNGHITPLTVTRTYGFAHNPCLGQRHTYLGDVDPALADRLTALNASIIERLGLPFGNTHAEFRLDDAGEIFLMEVAARGAGAGISSHVIPFLTGFNPLEALLTTLLGGHHDGAVRDYRGRFAVVHWFDFGAGTVKRVRLDDAGLVGLLALRLDVAGGRTMRAPRDSRDRGGYFIVGGDDRDDVLHRERRAVAAVRLEYE